MTDPNPGFYLKIASRGDVGEEERAIVIPEEGLRQFLKISLQDEMEDSLFHWRAEGFVAEKNILDFLQRYNSGNDRFSGLVDSLLYPLTREILERKGFVYSSEERLWLSSF